MNFVTNVTLDVYSYIILIIILFYSHRNDEKESIQYHLYHMMTVMTMCLLFADVCSRFDGRPDSIFPVINYFGNTILFVLSPVLPCLWFMYVDYQIFCDRNRIKKLVLPMLGMNVLFSCVVLFTASKGWLFFIDAKNIYHRGNFFGFAVLIAIAPMLASFFTIIKHRRAVERRHFFALAFFPIPPVLAIVVQLVFYGTSMILNSMTLSLLIVLLNIQNQCIYTDYLTGIGNRKKLEVYLKNKVKTSTFEDTFSGVMIDLDNFKDINDTYGHNMGDMALEASTRLIKSCLSANDFMARFGGDEFCLVLDVSEQEVLELMVHRIRRCIERFNNTSELPFDISLSMGYAIYNHKSKMTSREFEKKIDRLMYEQKLAKREKKCAGESF